MKDPELRSPQEWAETALKRASWNLSPTDCRELADRMDDLTEALRLLRSEWFAVNRQIGGEWDEQVAALLAKYADQED